MMTYREIKARAEVGDPTTGSQPGYLSQIAIAQAQRILGRRVLS